MIWNWPLASVTTERDFSMSTLLEASTVTPGSTPPELSRTVPAIVCAPASAGSARVARRARKVPRILCIVPPWPAASQPPVAHGNPAAQARRPAETRLDRNLLLAPRRESTSLEVPCHPHAHHAYGHLASSVCWGCTRRRPRD